MEQTPHNRRISDVEITQLIFRVDKLEADFHKLEQTVEAQTNINLQAHNELLKGINDIRQEVVGSRKTGWAAPTGTATRTTFATSTVTTELLAQRVKALIDDLISHGLIGS